MWQLRVIPLMATSFLVAIGQAPEEEYVCGCGFSVNPVCCDGIGYQNIYCAECEVEDAEETCTDGPCEAEFQCKDDLQATCTEDVCRLIGDCFTPELVYCTPNTCATGLTINGVEIPAEPCSAVFLDGNNLPLLECLNQPRDIGSGFICPGQYPAYSCPTEEKQVDGEVVLVGPCSGECPGYPGAECWEPYCEFPIFEGYAVDFEVCTGVWWDPVEGKIIEECSVVKEGAVLPEAVVLGAGHVHGEVAEEPAPIVDGVGSFPIPAYGAYGLY